MNMRSIEDTAWMRRWHIEVGAGGRFIIVNNRHRNLVLAHGHWTSRVESSAHPDSFADVATARKFARQVIALSQEE